MAGKVTYKEPASYFNADMKKAAKEYDRKKATEAKKTTKKGKSWKSWRKKHRSRPSGFDLCF